MADPANIALFGGTFDPVHLGHVAMATQAVESLQIDQVRFLPCRISPHKQECPPTPAASRLEMLRLATAGLEWAVVDDIEVRREGPSYSWQTVEAFRLRFPGSRLMWIMGVDQWDVLGSWDRPQHLASMVEFIVFSRGKPPLPREGFTLHPLENVHAASASRIRQDLARGADIHPWLDPRVCSWIREHKLYGTA